MVNDNQYIYAVVVHGKLVGADCSAPILMDYASEF